MSKKKDKRIGEMTDSRILWERKPHTQVVPNKNPTHVRINIKMKTQSRC